MWLEFIYKNPNRFVIDPGCLLSVASFRVRCRQFFIPHSRTGGGYQQNLMHGVQDRGSSLVRWFHWFDAQTGARRGTQSGSGQAVAVIEDTRRLPSAVPAGRADAPGLRSSIHYSRIAKEIFYACRRRTDRQEPASLQYWFMGLRVQGRKGEKSAASSKAMKAAFIL